MCVCVCVCILYIVYLTNCCINLKKDYETYVNETYVLNIRKQDSN